MACSHPWNKLSPVPGKSGAAHCGECNEEIQCSHPRALVDVGGLSEHCLGCGMIFLEETEVVADPGWHPQGYHWQAH